MTNWVILRGLTDDEIATRQLRTTAPAWPITLCPDCAFPLAQVEGIADGPVCMSCNVVLCIGTETLQ